ncbi:MAG: methyltransferase domain-containing protein [Acidobacteria bacterium]|nr:methyltransferase domain-containing protein [Acidobacteriota bacterium]MBI3426054.1 methyltransferase domain-containing protein [Acidobacteriota bacterium]
MHTLLPFNRPIISPTGCRGAHGWRKQFACPDGWVGAAVGHLMAYKNEAMNRFAVEQLRLAPDDQVLEIGFGHGKTIELMAGQVTRGLVAGVDLSMTMVTQAAKHNEAAIKAGRVELQQGSVSNIPYEYARFSKVVAANNYQFWPNPELDLTEIQRVLQPGGKLVLGLRLHSDSPLALAPGFKVEEVQEIAGLVRWVGFQNVRVETRQPGREAACVIAER